MFFVCRLHQAKLRSVVFFSFFHIDHVSHAVNTAYKNLIWFLLRLTPLTFVSSFIIHSKLKKRTFSLTHLFILGLQYGFFLMLILYRVKQLQATNDFVFFLYPCTLFFIKSTPLTPDYLRREQTITWLKVAIFTGVWLEHECHSTDESFIACVTHSLASFVFWSQGTWMRKCSDPRVFSSI